MSYKVPTDFKKEAQGFLEMNDFDEEEVYLIRVPKGFDITKLHGTEFSPSEIKELQVEEGANHLSSVYELGTFSGQGLDVAPLIKSNGKACLGPPVSGFLAVNKSYRVNPRVPRRTHKVTPTGPVPMPDGLKVRFTPFGASLPMKSSLDTTKKKKKKKRKHTIDADTSTNSPDSIPVKKKRRMEESVESSQDSVKKHKQKTSKELDSELDLVDFAQHHPINASGDGRYFASGIDNACIEYSSRHTESSKKHKRHKKDKHHSNESSFHEQNFKSDNTSVTAETDVIDGASEMKSKKSKNKAKLRVSFDESVFIDRTGNPKNSPLPDIVRELPDNSTALSDTGSHLVNGDSEHRKTKRKHSSGYGSVDTSLDSSYLDLSHGHTKKKKKKRRHEKD